MLRAVEILNISPKKNGADDEKMWQASLEQIEGPLRLGPRGATMLSYVPTSCCNELHFLGASMHDCFKKESCPQHHHDKIFAFIHPLLCPKLHKRIIAIWPAWHFRMFCKEKNHDTLNIEGPMENFHTLDSFVRFRSCEKSGKTLCLRAKSQLPA